MAYQNTYFPVSYQPYQNPYQTQLPQPPQAQQQNQQPTQNGFIRVQCENDARMYPVAPGNSVVFIDENLPYCYTKTVEHSQLDRPKFERYRLVKEEDTPPLDPTPVIQYAPKTETDAIWAEINAIKEKLTPKKVQARKKEEDDE